MTEEEYQKYLADIEKSKATKPPPAYEPDIAETKSLMPDGRKMSIAEFNSNEKVQQLGEDVFGFLSSANRLPQMETEDYTKDISEAMLDDWDLSVLANRAFLLKDAPEKVKASYRELRDIFDNQTEAKGIENLKLFGQGAFDVATDPSLYIAIAAGGLPGVIGRQAAVRAARQKIISTTLAASPKATASAKQLATGLSKNLDKTKVGRGLKGFGKRAVSQTAIGGAAYEGLVNIAEQSRDVAVDEKERIDKSEVALSAAFGALIGVAGDKTFEVGAETYKGIKNKYSKIAQTKADNNSEIQIPEGIDREVLKPEQLKDLKPNANPTDPPSKAAERLAQEIEGGDITARAIQDIVDESVKDLPPDSDITKDPSFLQKINRFALRQGTRFVLKPAEILSSPTLKKAGDIIKDLQTRFRYDLGSRKDGRKDFNETWRNLNGSYTNAISLALEPFRSTGALKGRLGFTDEVSHEIIMNGLRGAKVDNPDLAQAVKSLRGILDDFGTKLKDAGIIDKLLTNYLPRSWSRDAILNNETSFRKILVRSGEAKDDTEAKAIVKSMLDVQNRVDVNGSGSSFFYNRNFSKIDDLAAKEFLIEEDLATTLINYISQGSKQLAKVEVFEAKNLDEFKERWLDPIKTKLESEGVTFDKTDRQNIIDLYQYTTGEYPDGNQLGTIAGTAVNTYSTATRMALLPFATVSSISEVFIPFAKAGVLNSAGYKGFFSAFGTATKSSFDKTLQVLLNRGYTKQEAWRELEEVGLALESAAMDNAERLSGDIQGGKFNQKINNMYFKANFLDQWTRFVQLSSFTTGKNVIRRNLKSLSKRQGLKDSLKTRDERRELSELGIDVDEGIEWLNRGGKTDDPFYKKVKEGAARFSSEVILQPSAASGLKPTAVGNPKTQIFFQLLGYPIAFTRVVLGNAGRDIIKSPLRNTAGVLGAATAMMYTARFTNWVRSGGKSEEEGEYEANKKAFLRAGFGGILYDGIERGAKAREVWQSNLAGALGPLGPIGSDVYRLVKTGDLGHFLKSKLPGYAAFKAIERDTGIPIDTATDELRKDINEVLRVDAGKRDLQYKKGGEVNVPNAPEEPDERVDRMTGLPYNFQAGIAFRDEEDPIKRLGLAGGSLAKGDSINRLLGRRDNA